MLDLDVISEPRPLVAVLRTLGYPITSSKLRVWHHRGRLPVHGTTAAGHNLYRLGDVHALLTDTPTPPTCRSRNTV